MLIFPLSVLGLTLQLQVFVALVKHTAPILTTAEWHEAMCINTETARFDELIDTLADVPALLGEVDELVASSNNSIINWRADLLQSFLTLADKIDTWQSNFRDVHSKAAFWAVHSTLHNPTDDAFKDKLFPFSLD